MTYICHIQCQWLLFHFMDLENSTLQEFIDLQDIFRIFYKHTIIIQVYSEYTYQRPIKRVLKGKMGAENRLFFFGKMRFHALGMGFIGQFIGQQDLSKTATKTMGFVHSDKIWAGKWE